MGIRELAAKGIGSTLHGVKYLNPEKGVMERKFPQEADQSQARKNYTITQLDNMLHGRMLSALADRRRLGPKGGGEGLRWENGKLMPVRLDQDEQDKIDRSKKRAEKIENGIGTAVAAAVTIVSLGAISDKKR